MTRKVIGNIKKAIIVVGGLALLLFFWTLISPLFIDVKVNEASPIQSVSLKKSEPSLNQGEVESTEFQQEVLYESEIKIDNNKEFFIKKSGSFIGADTFHRGSGKSLVLESKDETFIRLENFEVTNGPDLYVVLSKEKKPLESEGIGEHIEIGKLKGNIGNQNYEILKSVDILEYNSIIIYCKAFNVIFAVATLS